MEYNDEVARQYATYRPPLHAALLRQCLADRFHHGLDVGCGTGHSTHALRAHCDRVVGTDPSAEMLRQAPPGPGISYQLQGGEKLDFPTATFDVVTFAGSLYYARSQSLVDEVVRVCRPGARIVVYDFTAPLRAHCTALLGLEGVEDLVEDYDATVNLDGLNPSVLRVLTTARGAVAVAVEPDQLTALYLSDPPLAELLQEHYGKHEDELPQRITTALAAKAKGEPGRLAVTFETYATVYAVG
ncbi:SAM-dependent methyltransferase [Lewinella marina]|uniref:STAS domain-containing protein n=1 Tax=Neolewinella marina TaxID=438751 RepID=A0A2G0CJD1_9BACT|nr:class I SAM-dependent methyltransferase [Neolewinella marina]NJB84766.1 SAM-dependent methyltransferase [Neolewinella marina]PHL00075.1 hypothetical protein CGL56_03275 [Neolewinella marina]